jgi:hypothetical protein
VAQSTFDRSCRRLPGLTLTGATWNKSEVQ